MENIFEEIGIPNTYLKKTNSDDRFIAFVHKLWLKSLVKHSKLIEFIEKPNLEAWPITDDEIGHSWMKVFVSVYKKRDAKVIPLPRIRPYTKDDNPLKFPQLIHYISQTNYKNLWKEAYKKYTQHSETTKDTHQVTLVDYNDALRETISRTYGCQIHNLCNPQLSTDEPKHFDQHFNVFPSICALETLNALFVFHLPYVEHNLNHCVTFSPAILEKCNTKPLFVIYQLLQLLKSLHDRSLTMGAITLNDIYLTEDLWIYVFPQINSNIHVQDVPKFELKKFASQDCRKTGHKFDTTLKCEFCGVKTYDKVQIKGESLEKVCRLWIEGQISNFTYISVLNRLSGRKLGDPNCHYVFPWVTDFASRCGRNWRDLKKSKYRLNKGDRQLDLTYDNSQTQVPHHVSDVLSSITYYVYMARQTPKSVLCKNVRTIWVPAEYPTSIQRMQEWTPDECIPEFFTDPSVFRSIHDDLDDLEVPCWASGPEDFVERHREILESSHVSERLHHWIDLTFGYKLSGHAAVKAKNVCLHLADDHTTLTNSGIVQLFTNPHPPKTVSSMFWAKTPPKITLERPTRQRSRDVSVTSHVSGDCDRSDEEEGPSTSRSPLALTKILSRSRSSLNEDQGSKPTRSSSNQRSTSLGPKNPTFTSHVTTKTKSTTGTIHLPKDYKPEAALEALERKCSFFSNTFHTETNKNHKNIPEETTKEPVETEKTIQNAFTNFIYDGTFRTIKDKKYLTVKNDNKITCDYSRIISTRRTKELQVLGVLLVEIFMPKQLRALGTNDTHPTFISRLKSSLTVLGSCKKDIPRCVYYILELLLGDNKETTVTNKGLPRPSPHLLLEPLLDCIVPFPSHFNALYKILRSLKEFESVATELDVLYHFNCDGTMCQEHETSERTKVLFAQNIAECKVKLCARQLGEFLEDVNPNTHEEIVAILLPYVRNLIEEPPTSVLSAWYLFDPIARMLGARKSSIELLDCILKLYEYEPNEMYLPYNKKIAKLYHHSFLLRLMVRFGLKCFLEHFVTALVEAVGGYKDYERIEFVLHTHSERALRKTSHLKSMEMFELEEENEPQMRSLMEHLEMNAASDLPFDFSAAEEALDLDVVGDGEESEDGSSGGIGVATPCIPIPSSCRDSVGNISCEIGSKKSDTSSFLEKKSQNSQLHSQSSQFELNLDSPASNFDSSRMSTSASSSSKHTGRSRRADTKISDMSTDSVVWLSHRLGPVLMARYLSRNLLKMLTLCYVGKDNLTFISSEEPNERHPDISIAGGRVTGDQNAVKVLECLTSIAALYGEQLILFQYIPHITELIVLCKKRLTANLEGGLISCLALLKHIVPYLSDGTLMDQLQDVLLKSILHPIVRLLGSTKYTFPSGYVSRNVLARKYVDTLYILAVRVGSDMTRRYLAVPALQRFFLIFDKVYANEEINIQEDKPSPDKDSPLRSTDQSHYIELKRDGTTTEWSVGGRPLQISHVRLKDSESESLSPNHSTSLTDENTSNLALDELQSVFQPHLAHDAYLPFLKHLGEESLEISLKNHRKIRELCQQHEQETNTRLPKMNFGGSSEMKMSSSIGSNINVIGNRIDVQQENDDRPDVDLLSLVSSRMENNARHLRGNWLAYWEHEIGRSDKDTMFNFKQIKLQTFVGHANSVKCLYVLDNENSFISGSRDKTVKLWSLRSHGDGFSNSGCQWTYTAHKKSILSLAFVESMRLVASCDSVVHIWDPFMGANVGHLESPKYSPVNVLKSTPAPSSLVFAATTEGTVKVVDVRLANYVYDLKITVNPAGLIRCLVVSPSGTWVAAGQSSGNVTVLDTRTGLVISNWKAHESEVLQLVALDDEVLISSSLDQTINVWNVSDGRFKFYLRGCTEPVHCLNVYNSELISGTTANRVGVHTAVSADASFSSTKLRSDAFKGLLTSMAVLPLNRLLLLGSDTGNINLLC